MGAQEGHTDFPSAGNHSAMTEHLCSMAAQKLDNQGQVLLSPKPYAAAFRM